MAERYFGSQYDSIKQSAYLDYISKSDEDKGKMFYQVILDDFTARLRLDILLGGHVIITDAMFFDGIYFQTLFLHKELKADFINFLNLSTIGGNPPLIEIRQRKKTIKETLYKMLYKKDAKDGFLFSSISDNYVKSTVADALVKVQNSGHELTDWKSVLALAINYMDDSIVKDELNSKIEYLQSMTELPSNILKEWEGKFDFNKVLEEAIQQRRFRIQRTGDDLIDSVIAEIEKEIIKPNPNRSGLMKKIANKTEILLRPPKTTAEKTLELIWGQFLQVYNRTIGLQHYCDTFDIGEIPLNDNDITMTNSEYLSQSTIQALAKESWIEFGKKFNNINKFRNKWLEEIWKLDVERNRSTKHAKKALEKYIKMILQEYRVIPNFASAVNLIGGGASTDVDIMKSNSISLSVGLELIKIPFQIKDYLKQIWVYNKDKSNLIEYGKKFIRRS